MHVKSLSKGLNALSNQDSDTGPSDPKAKCLPLDHQVTNDFFFLLIRAWPKLYLIFVTSAKKKPKKTIDTQGDF